MNTRAKKIGFLAAGAVVLVLVFSLSRNGSATQNEVAKLPDVPDTGSATSTSPRILISPKDIQQGEPAKIVVEGVGTSTVTSLTLSGKKLDTFILDNRPTAVVGIDLKKPDGAYPLVATLSSGEKLEAELLVGKRYIAEAPLGIPEKLGGNTTAGQERLLASLARDNAVLNSVPTTKEVLWKGKFRYPVDNPVVTDTYGYSRLTVATTISHKGTDFRAPIGTPVYAMNSGIVRIARNFTAYGNAVIIDHGFGIQTMYMHMSELDVKEGDRVEKGGLLGKSGDTGYAEGPHLHISVKIGGISIDPEAFLRIF
jgi:murein DD-endopeptidase MepM/ murein hydrolase activator NlpD